MKTISLDAAIAVSGLSRSTLFRRVREGALRAGEKDALGRSTLVLADVLALAEDLSFEAEDVAVLLRADADEAGALADMGAWFYLHERDAAAHYWLRRGARQGSAEAMQWLATAWAEGRGENGEPRAAAEDEDETDDAASQATRAACMAVMWLARAAALGQPLARRQMAGLLQATLQAGPESESAHGEDRYTGAPGR